jgi:CelD/BcsL family acetyltransferase involved in cellulose biosynthesis
MGVKSTCEHRVHVGASLLPIDQLTEGDLDAWRALAEAAVEPNPFFHPDFALAVAEGLGASGISVLVVREGADWLACLPVERGRGWRRLPLHSLVAWNHLYCFLCTPLARTDGLDESMAELLEEGVRRSGGFLGLDLLATDGPVSAALERAGPALGSKPVELDRFERATLARREDGDYLALSAKHRRNFERLRRNLERDLGGELSLRDRSDDLEAREEFLRLEASGWKGEGGTGTAFAPIGHGDLFLSLCERMAARDMLQLVSAEIGGRSVAMLCDLIAGDTVFTFKIAAEAELSKYSPGIQLSILYLDRFQSLPGIRRADSCAEPGNEMINRLWPDRRELGIRAIPAANAKGALARPPLKGMAWLRRRRR